MFDDESLDTSIENHKEIRVRHNHNYFNETGFGFIDDHAGLRKGMLHVLLGTTGQGKSTLSRSVMLALARKHKVILYSSEETKEHVQAMISEKTFKSDLMRNIIFIDEREVKQHLGSNSEINEWLNIIQMKVKEHKADAFMFDNLTTSGFYSSKLPNQQSDIADKIGALALSLNIPFFIIMHTAKGVTDSQLITADDVKGTRDIANKAHIFYVFQRFVSQSASLNISSTAFVRVLKCRTLRNNLNQTYLLTYDHEENIYFSDEKVSFNKFLEIYKTRQRLGK